MKATRLFLLLYALTLLYVSAMLPAVAQTQGERGVGVSAVTRHYYALVIGNNVYKNVPHLKTAETDAKSVETILREQYGFQTRLLLNATRQQIIAALNAYRRELNADASLLIYYAGHGVNDKEIDRAYWLPVDAARDDNSNWISADDITSNIRGIPAKHVLIVSDSCYSGTLTRGLDVVSSVPAVRERYLQKMSAGRSRTLMASGGNEPVADAGGVGNHSVFASALVQGLQQTEKNEFTAAELYREYVEESVAGRASQTPEYNPLRNSGHESGDFVFVRVKTADGKTVEVTVKTSPAGAVDPAVVELSFWETIKGSSDPEDFRSYLQKYPNGQFAELARRRMGPPQPTAQPSSSAIVGTGPVADQYIKSGDELGRENKWAEAEVDYKLAVRLDPGNPEWHNKLGYALTSNRKFSEAEAEYRTALRLTPNNAESHYGVARALREQKRLVESESETREAIRLEPNNAKFHASLGNTLGIYGQKYAEAEAELGQAIRLEPNNADWHSYLSVVLKGQKKYTEAEAEAGQSIRLEPKNAERHDNLAMILAEQEKYTEAVAEAREVLLLAPNQSWSHSFLSRVLLRQDKVAEAETEAREAIRLDPKNAYAHWVLGTSLLDQKRNAAEAEVSLREAVRLEPNEGSFHHNLGVALEKQGKTAEAEAEYKEELRVDPVLREKANEEARQTKSFRGAYGFNMSLVGDFFNPGTLNVSPTKIEFKYDMGGSVLFDCARFAEAHVKGSSIYDIKIEDAGKWRFNAESPSVATNALEAIRSVCQKK